MLMLCRKYLQQSHGPNLDCMVLYLRLKVRYNTGMIVFFISTMTELNSGKNEGPCRTKY